MSDELTDLSWVVPKSGFRWCSASSTHSTPYRRVGVTPQSSLFLVSAVPDTHLQPGERYSPLLRYTGLFKQLADTPATKEGIREFANKYGRLGGAASVPVSVSGEPDIANGEPFEEWKVAILNLRTTVQIWEAADKPDLKALSKMIHWEPAGVIYRVPGDTDIIATTKDTGLMARFKHGDLVEPAMYLVQTRINKRMKEYGVIPVLLRDPRVGVVLRLSANSLIGGIWLQFAKAVEGNKEYRQCQNEHCRRWMEVGGNRTARSDKKFCSPSCKADAHRRKRERALILHRSGSTPPTIARELDVEETTVRTWIEKRSELYGKTKTR